MRRSFLYKGEKFDRQGDHRYLKDVLFEGRWIHPSSGRLITFPLDRMRKLVDDTNRWMAAGNKVRFTDGHPKDGEVLKMKDVLGDWPEGFIVVGKKMFGVAAPKDKTAIERIESGALDAVSIGTQVNVIDQAGNEYDEIIDHVAATPYPVVTRQGDFVALSSKLDIGDRECFVPEALSIDLEGGDEMDRKKLAQLVGVPEDANDEKIQAAIGKLKEAKPDTTAVVKETTEKVTASITSALEGHGLKLSLEGDKVQIQKATDREPTAAEKKAQERMDLMDERFRKQTLGVASARVKQLIEEGKVPPAQKESVMKLLSIHEKVTGLALGQDGKKIEDVSIGDIADVSFSLLSGLPSVHDSKLKQLSTFDEGDKNKTETDKSTKLGQDVASRVGETHSAEAAAAAK